MRMLAALALLLATASEASARDGEYWVLGLSNDGNLLNAVDAASITSPTANTRRAWTWMFYGPQHQQYPGEYVVSLREFNCESRQHRLLESAMYTASGEPIPLGAGANSWEYAIPNTVIESELDFACASPETWASRGVRINGTMTPRERAAAEFAR